MGERLGQKQGEALQTGQGLALPVAEQYEIKNFTSIGLGVQRLFPGQDVLPSVLSLENLRPDPTKDDNPFLLVKVGPDGGSEVFKTGGKKIKTVKGVIVWVDEQGLGFLDSAMGEAVGRLSVNTPVWILEQNSHRLSEEEKKERGQKLVEWGLVERKVVQKTGVNFDYCWYGRTERPAKHDKVYDLTLDGRFGNLLREMKEGYLREGWIEVDCQEIVDLCRMSKIPFLEGINSLLERLNLGFGIKIKAPCGCGWHVCLNGDWERDFSQKCGDEDCDGLPKETKPLSGEEMAKLLQLVKEKPKGRTVLIGYNIPCHLVGPEMHCFGCGAEMMVDRVRQSGTEVLSDLKCPHCGEWRSESNPRIIKLGKGDEVKEY